MKRKWLSMLLALALVFSLAPAMALAKEQTVTNDTELKAAIEDKDVTKIILSPDVDYILTTPLNISRSLEIICEGGTATFKGNPKSTNGAFKISGGSGVTVTLQNINFEDFGGDTTSGDVIIAGASDNAFAGMLTISDCKISNFGKNGITVKGGKADISNVIVDAGSEVLNRAPNGIQIDINATANISDCTITNSNSTHDAWSATGILALRGGNAKISDVKFEKCQIGFMVENGYDGTSYTTKGSNSTINKCTFASCSYPMWDRSSEKKTSVTGNNNTWEVSSGAELDVDLINQIPVGTTIKLKDNIKLNAMLDIQQDGITLDLDGHTITASESFPTVGPGGYTNDKHLINVSGKNVTIKNGTLKTTASNKHALNVYQTTGAVIENLTIDHSVSLGGAPIIVNASELIVKGSLSMTLGEKSWYGINVDPKEANASLTFEAGSQVTMTGKDEDVVRLDGDSTRITIANAEDAGLAKDEDGNYILAQNPEVQPPTPPTSGGGSDDTLWPNILQHPQSVSAPAGSLATFSVVANGGPLSYQWQVDRRDGKGFVSIPGATGATLTVGPVTGAENGYQYRCAVTLYGATMYSGAGQLFVTAGMIPKTGDMPGSPALLLALAGLGLAAWVVARRRAG